MRKKGGTHYEHGHDWLIVLSHNSSWVRAVKYIHRVVPQDVYIGMAIAVLIDTHTHTYIYIVYVCIKGGCIILGTPATLSVCHRGRVFSIVGGATSRVVACPRPWHRRTVLPPVGRYGGELLWMQFPSKHRHELIAIE